MSHPLRGAAAITGLGMTPMGRIYGKSATELAADAVRSAIADAGLAKHEVDGLLINAGITGFTGGGIALNLQNYLGLTNLRLLNHMNAAGSADGAMRDPRHRSGDGDPRSLRFRRCSPQGRLI